MNVIERNRMVYIERTENDILDFGIGKITEVLKTKFHVSFRGKTITFRRDTCECLWTKIKCSIKFLTKDELKAVCLLEKQETDRRISKLNKQLNRAFAMFNI